MKAKCIEAKFVLGDEEYLATIFPEDDGQEITLEKIISLTERDIGIRGKTIVLPARRVFEIANCLEQIVALVEKLNLELEIEG